MRTRGRPLRAALVPGARPLAHGPWRAVPGARSLAHGSWSAAPGARLSRSGCQAHGARKRVGLERRGLSILDLEKQSRTQI